MQIGIRLWWLFLFSGVIARAWSQSGEYVRIDLLDTAYIRTQVDSLNQLADQYPTDVIFHLNVLLQQNRASKDIHLTLQILLELATLSGKAGRYEAGLNYAYRGLKLCDSQIHRIEIAGFYNAIGNIYNHQARFLMAYKMFLKAEYFAEGDLIIQGKTWNNMGIVLSALGYPQKARGYLNKAVSAAVQCSNGKLWVTALLNIGTCYASLGDTDAKLLYIDSAVSVAQQQREYWLLKKAIAHKAKYLISEGLPNEALTLIKHADTLLKYIGDFPIDRKESYEIRGFAYQQLKEYGKAEYYWGLALQGANVRDEINLLARLSELYAEVGKYQSAYKTYRSYKRIVDSFASTNVHLQLNELETQYRTAEKDKAIADQKLLVAQKAHQVKMRNLWLGIIGGGSLLLAGFSVVVFRNMRHKQRLHLAREENARLRALMEGEEEERKRISGELHDGIGGVLSAAKMSFSGMQYLKREDVLKYHQGIQLLDEAYKELRHTAHNLSPELLKQQGLLVATAGFCDKLALAHQLDISFQYFGNFSDLSESFMLSAYRIIQELIHNVVKHASASKVLVQLVKEGTLVDLTVEDDGIGMPEEKATGLGLHNLARRVKALKGVLEVDSRSAQGTTVYITGLKTDVPSL